MLRESPHVKTRSVSLKSGKKHGKSITYGGFYRRKDSEKNSVAVIENYQNGEKHGKFIIYDKKIPSKITTETDYIDGLQQREMRLSPFDGGKTITFYHPKGKWSEKTGSLSYNRAGQLSNMNCPKAISQVPELNEVCGFNGKSQVVILRDKNGKITTEALFRQGQTQERKTFYASGNLRSKAKQDLKQFFYENGKLKQELTGDASGALTVKDYYPSGKKKSLERSDNHILTEEREWYMNGKPKRAAFHQAKTRTVMVKSYHGNGQLPEDYTFIRDSRYSSKRIGHVQIYYENGKRQEDSNYDNNGKLLNENIYFDNGNLMRSSQFDGDGSRTVKEYEKNGGLKKSESYYSDGSVKQE